MGWGIWNKLKEAQTMLHFVIVLIAYENNAIFNIFSRKTTLIFGKEIGQMKARNQKAKLRSEGR